MARLSSPRRLPGRALKHSSVQSVSYNRQARGRRRATSREAIALYASEQMSRRQISEVLEIPINTAKTLIHRARASLARAFEEGTEDVVSKLPAFELAGEISIRRSKLIEWIEKRERAYARSKAESEVAAILANTE